MTASNNQLLASVMLRKGQIGAALSIDASPDCFLEFMSLYGAKVAVKERL